MTARNEQGATENKVPCFLCNGTGAVMGDAPGLVTSCITCSGTGYVPSSTPSAFPMLTPTKLELCEKYGVHGIDYHERAEFVIQLCRAARAFITSSAKVPAWESCVRCGAAILSQHPEAEATSSATVSPELQVIRNCVRVDAFGDFVVMFGDSHENEDVKQRWDEALRNASDRENPNG